MTIKSFLQKTRLDILQKLNKWLAEENERTMKWIMERLQVSTNMVILVLQLLKDEEHDRILLNKIFNPEIEESFIQID